MKKALVTGGCGFIGSNLTKELVRQGWQVDIVDDMSNGHLELLNDLDVRLIPNASFLSSYRQSLDKGFIDRGNSQVLVIQDDFASKDLLKYIQEKNYNTIFHQAAIPRVSYSVENPGITTESNILKSVILFEACINNVDRIVSASSSSVYGGADILPTTEQQCKDPKSPYAWQKSAIEDYAKIAYELYQLEIVCLRYFNVYGPGQYGDSPYSTAVSAWCHATKNNLTCRSDGDGSQSRDMCYIDNTVSANILAAEAKGPFAGERYNIACNARTTNKEILDHFVSEFGSKVEHAPWRQGDVMHTQADISKAKLAFGYEPLVSFWEGLERTVQWWGLRDG